MKKICLSVGIRKVSAGNCFVFFLQLHIEFGKWTLPGNFCRHPGAKDIGGLWKDIDAFYGHARNWNWSFFAVHLISQTIWGTESPVEYNGSECSSKNETAIIPSNTLRVNFLWIFPVESCPYVGPSPRLPRRGQPGHGIRRGGESEEIQNCIESCSERHVFLQVSIGLTATTIVSQWTWSATLLQSSTVASKVR